MSRAVDQSLTRNKRNDRLAEGHDRLAGAGMVLRSLSDRAPLIGACHCLYFHAKTDRENASGGTAKSIVRRPTAVSLPAPTSAKTRRLIRSRHPRHWRSRASFASGPSARFRSSSSRKWINSTQRFGTGLPLICSLPARHALPMRWSSDSCSCNIDPSRGKREYDYAANVAFPAQFRPLGSKPHPPKSVPARHRYFPSLG